MKMLFCFSLLIGLFFSACKKEEKRQIDNSYNPVLLPADFTNPTAMTHPYFLFEVGKTYIYEGQTAEGMERTEIARQTATKNIFGITCVVVNDKVFLAGKLIEDTFDWYAQDNAGNVWYFGEDVDNYNLDGSLKDHAGSWEAGVDGAKAGLVMPADPQKGKKYRQEYYFNEAEDQAEIIETGLSVTVPFGTFTNCIKTHDWTELEPDVNENKFYASGVGIIKSVNVTDNETHVLIEIK